MVTEWTIRRSVANKNEQPRWEVWETAPHGYVSVLSSGTLLGLLADFPDHVLATFDGISKEVTEA